MTRLRRRLLRGWVWARSMTEDLHVYAGIALVAFGAGELHAALGPMVAGAGLIWIVRSGGETVRRR